jgi:hypothetical protein
LWDRTGECPEIEELERELAVFRLADDSLPLIPPVAVTASTEASPAGTARSWRWLLPVTALAGVIMLGVFVGFQTGFKNDGVTKVKTEISAERQQLPKDELVASNAQPIPDEDVDTKRETRVETKPAVVTHRKMKLVPKSAVKGRRNQKSDVSIEEKAAYEQLVLALSITGAKLRLVQEKTQVFGTTPTVR